MGGLVGRTPAPTAVAEELLLSLFVFADTVDDITLFGKGLLEVGETTLGCGCCGCCDLVSGRLLLEVEEEAAVSTILLEAPPLPPPPPPPPSEEVELRLSETLGLEEDMGEAAPLTDDAGLNEAPVAPFAPRGRLLPEEGAPLLLSSFNRT